MEILSDTQAVEDSSAITIGVFDGVHAGHQKVLKQLNAVAVENSLKSVLVTFDVHPLSVLAPGHAPKMLLSLERRLEIIEKTGLVDCVLVIEFNEERSLTSAQDFVEQVLISQLKMKNVLVGSNFVFGHGRRGNVAMLKTLGQEKDFSVIPIDLLTNESESPISSTLIRQYISVGNVNKAKELLTRPHELKGVVVHGDKIGTDLGYPTANTEVDQIMSVPADGVYSGRVVLQDGREFLSAISIGVRPMFHEDNIRVIEPHILDFSGDLYGQHISIQFEDKIRDQLVLESKEALVEQIDKDIMQVRSTL